MIAIGNNNSVYVGFTVLYLWDQLCFTLYKCWWKFADFILILTIMLSFVKKSCCKLDHVKRIWYLSPMRAAKVQASLRIRAVSPEPSLLAHTISESSGTFRQKARSLAPLNGWACAIKMCHDGMLEDTNSLDGAQMVIFVLVCHLSKRWHHVFYQKRASVWIKFLYYNESYDF